jgi:Ca-activated chloride channel homolog
MLWLIALLPALLAVQEPREQAPQRFTSHSALVVVPVSVIDRKAGLVAGLPQDAFTIYDNGKPQTITVFENADRPVTVGLLIDSSISMLRRREAVVAAGTSFANSCHPEDEMFTINFNERIWPGLPEGMAFTSDRAELTRALNRSGARGQTALFDALWTGLAHLATGHHQKKVLIVVSDGGDNASRRTYDDVLAAASQMDAVIYTVSIDDVDQSEANPDLLKKLARTTGGESFFLRQLKHVAPTLERISRDIRSGYTIGYVPTEPGRAGERHTIRVDVRAPDRRKLAVRARSEYVAGGAGR